MFSKRQIVRWLMDCYKEKYFDRSLKKRYDEFCWYVEWFKLIKKGAK